MDPHGELESVFCTHVGIPSLANELETPFLICKTVPVWMEAPSGFEAPLQAFRRPGGVVLLVMSLAFSRGPELVQNEMDDPAAKLTSQFGHCGQELINLLLTGQAGKYSSAAKLSSGCHSISPRLPTV